MSKLKTINIKGKEYVEVNERIRAFRELYPNGSILTDMLTNENGVCVFKVQVINDGQILATGHAYEKEGSTFINKTSYIENCETSAIGRALGILGIGIDTSIASAEEVTNAVNNQKDDVKDLPVAKAKEKLVKAHEDGKLKEAFFSLSTKNKEELRDFANDLRAS